MFVAMPCLLAGCLVPDPEKFPEPERTAILVDTNLVSPPISQILRVNPPEVREFQIPFRSVDLGDPPAAYLYLDYDTPQEVPIGQDTLKTPSNEGSRRDFSVFARFAGDCMAESNQACCHRVTLIAMHESSVLVSDAGVRPDPIRSEGDQTRVGWWVGFAPAGSTWNQLVGCPTPTGTP